MSRVWRVLPALLIAACGGNIKEGQRIEELAEKRKPEDTPVLPSGPVTPDQQRAMENYRKLLDLPQDPATRAETLRRLADLQLEAEDAPGVTPEQSEQRRRESVQLYETVLKENPDGAGNDRVLYQLARAYQDVGEAARAEETLATLVKRYPQSEFVDDARFRRAELLFRLGQYEEAAVEYRHVLDLKDQTPFFEPAQYKYGWALFKQAKYDAALDVFITVLTRELPHGELTDEAAALAGVAAAKRDFAKDALRVASLSLSYLGGGDAANQYFKQRREPGFSPLLYRALGVTLLEKKRYTDAARAYTAFIDAHPRHALAPAFQSEAIAAQQAGGFSELVVQEKERFIRAYDPAAPYWTGRSPTPEVQKGLREHLEDLARFYQARGQKTRDDATAKPQEDFTAAAKHYRRLLELFPQDAKAAELRFLMAESLFESGQTMAAAAEYERVAADYPNYEKAPDAAYAALLAYQRRSTEVPPAERTAALRKSVAAALALAERFASHPQAMAALTRAAEDLYKLEDWGEAVKVAARVLRTGSGAAPELRQTALGVTADAQFNQKHYADAEIAYVELLKTPALTAEQRNPWLTRLATSIYKQAEVLRDGGNLRGAADTFLRVGRLAPGAAIQPTAEFDAAAALLALKDWAGAATVLEAFRQSYPGDKLLPDVDKKLAVAYQSAGRNAEAAAVLKRIAQGGESPEVRRDAAWLALTLLEQSKDARLEAEYLEYLKAYPQPIDRATQVREKLVALAAARGDEAARLQRLRDLVAADATAGAARTDVSKLAAAKATLELGRVEARRASALSLNQPLKATLGTRKEATERALATLTQAIGYGFADVTTAATYELGGLYQDLSRALLASERPKKLSALELEQYSVLLEEQAFPFEEKAIQFYEANLARVSQGLYDPWIGKSLDALAQIAPGKYGKREQTAEFYDHVR